jgi:hypothetical protein
VEKAWKERFWKNCSAATARIAGTYSGVASGTRIAGMPAVRKLAMPYGRKVEEDQGKERRFRKVREQL